MNLAAAVNVVLADRMTKRQLAGSLEVLPVSEMLNEHRGFCETPALDQVGWDGK